MNALIYLKKRIFINKIKTALRTPKAYFFILLIVFYCIMMLSFFVGIAENIGGISTENFVGLITILMFLTKPTSIISYIKRKGIVFKKADVQIAFPSPISPKTNLIFTNSTAFLLSFAFAIAFGLIGNFAFKTAIIPTLIYMLFLMFIEPVFEGGMIVLLYGNEVLSDKALNLIKILMYTIIGVFALGILINLFFKGFNFQTLNQLLFSPWVLGIPIVGWMVAVANILFLGPTLFSTIFAFCYAIFFVVIVILAKKITCKGEYYEDAMKFALDYEEARIKGRQGEVVQIGKKKKYKKANISYKGTYAKAIFYRQILEYKKNKFFIFGGRTLLISAVAIALSITFSLSNIKKELGENVVFIIPGIMLYIDFIFSGYVTKWGKELTFANLFLIPDTAVHKLWYATLMEHIRAFIDALILTIPIGIALKLSFFQIILILLVSVLIQAIKLYMRVFIHGIFGDSIGAFGKQMLHLLFYAIIIAIPIIPTIFITLALGASIGLLSLNVIMICLTFGCVLAAAEIFKKMEAVG